MSVLEGAIDAANERKKAVGLPEYDPSGAGILTYAETSMDDRAVFSGFDIDYDDLVKYSNIASCVFAQQACNEHPLLPLFRACWVDGLLIGLMVRANVAPHHEAPGPDSVPGSGVTPPEDGDK